MRMYDIIMKKRNGEALSDAEISFFVSAYVAGDIADYQMAALLMAIWFRGLDERETAALTMAMAASGDTVDLSGLPGVKADKHSTGGVGDKTTLILAPIVAACGVKVAKMSGRGLGHTGGTVDKLAAIPGFRTELGREEFLAAVQASGLSVIGQSGNLAAADKKLYALRDVTATVDSLPLIASSIMSKKLAAGSDVIVLDVKTGSGALMKRQEDSLQLAQAMVKLGTSAGRRTAALITGMDEPLGYAVGNSLEVKEAVDVLRGVGPADTTALSVLLAAHMLSLAGKGDLAACREMAAQAIRNRAALAHLKAMVTAQGGEAAALFDVSLLPQAACRREVTASEDGYLTQLEAELCGRAAMALGAGRATKESTIDLAAGLVLAKKCGAAVKKGDTLATLFAADEKRLDEGERLFRAAVSIGSQPPEPRPLVYAYVDEAGVRYEQSFAGEIMV